MTPAQFERLWKLPDKCVISDVVFRTMDGLNDVFEIRTIPILNSITAEDAFLLNGNYNCRTHAIKFNLRIKDLGPVCRYCINGAVHGDVGRHHRHIYKRLGDPRRNLPFAERRDDLVGLTAQQAWEKLCLEAGITHTGEFFEPEVKC